MRELAMVMIIVLLFTTLYLLHKEEKQNEANNACIHLLLDNKGVIDKDDVRGCGVFTDETLIWGVKIYERILRCIGNRMEEEGVLYPSDLLKCAEIEE